MFFCAVSWAVLGWYGLGLCAVLGCALLLLLAKTVLELLFLFWMAPATFLLAFCVCAVLCRALLCCVRCALLLLGLVANIVVVMLFLFCKASTGLLCAVLPVLCCALLLLQACG